MSESLERKQTLEGIGGWLVLFQIYIIMAAATPIQTGFLALIIGNTIFSGFSEAFRIYYYTFLAVSFIISLLCTIFFYRRKMVFRKLFTAYSLLAIAFSLIYYLSGEFMRYVNEASVFSVFIADFLNVVSIITIVSGIGIYTAFIIALYKSKRVKNTFS